MIYNISSEQQIKEAKMIDVMNVLEIIKQGQNTNVPDEVIIKAIKQYCEKIINIEQSNQPQTEGGNND